MKKYYNSKQIVSIKVSELGLSKTFEYREYKKGGFLRSEQKEGWVNVWDYYAYDTSPIYTKEEIENIKDENGESRYIFIDDIPHLKAMVVVYFTNPKEPPFIKYFNTNVEANNFANDIKNGKFDWLSYDL
jgi:hypothetical protein